MLSEQFRGVMKEERRKFQEELKVSSFLLVVWILRVWLIGGMLTGCCRRSR
jgi:hypothetical protein